MALHIFRANIMGVPKFDFTRAVENLKPASKLAARFRKVRPPLTAFSAFIVPRLGKRKAPKIDERLKDRL